MKSATVSFGQVLFPGVVDPAIDLVRAADVLVVVVNDEPTPYDAVADLVVRGRAGELLGSAVAEARG